MENLKVSQSPWKRLLRQSERFAKRNQHEAAMELGEEALRRARQSGAAMPTIGGILCQLGNIYQALGVWNKERRSTIAAKRAFAKAGRYYKQALKMSEYAKGRARSEAIFTTRGNMACLLANQGHHEKADRMMTLAAMEVVPKPR